MVENEQGLDSDLDYTATDNPFWDCTDGAHPAWWRGEDHGCKAIVRIVNKWLDETPNEMMKGVSQPEIQALKERIYSLRAISESYGRHHSNCVSRRSQYADGECDCGWNKIRKSLDKT